MIEENENFNEPIIPELVEENEEVITDEIPVVNDMNLAPRYYEVFTDCKAEGRLIMGDKWMNIPIANDVSELEGDPNVQRIIATSGIKCIFLPMSPMGPMSKKQESELKFQTRTRASFTQPDIFASEIHDNGLIIKRDKPINPDIYNLCNGLQAFVAITDLYSEYGLPELVALIFPRTANIAFSGGDTFSELNYEFIGLGYEEAEDGTIICKSATVLSDPYLAVTDEAKLMKVGEETMIRLGFIDAVADELEMTSEETEFGYLRTYNFIGDVVLETGKTPYPADNPINGENPLLLWMHKILTGNILD